MFDEIIDAIAETLPWEVTLTILTVGVLVIICMV